MDATCHFSFFILFCTFFIFLQSDGALSKTPFGWYSAYSLVLGLRLLLVFLSIQRTFNLHIIQSILTINCILIARTRCSLVTFMSVFGFSLTKISFGINSCFSILLEAKSKVIISNSNLGIVINLFLTQNIVLRLKLFF